MFDYSPSSSCGVHVGVSEILIVGLLGIVIIIMAGFFISPMVAKHRLPGWAAYIFGILYIGLLLSHYILLRNLEHGVALVFFVILVTWLSDTGGFFVGKTLGKHPLALDSAPKKPLKGYLAGSCFRLSERH